MLKRIPLPRNLVQYENMRQHFRGAAAKYLSAVDADPSKSHQHEIGGLPSVGFKQLLGAPGKGHDVELTLDSTMVYLEEGEVPIITSGSCTWYDSRRNDPHRSAEYRLYYPNNDVTNRMQTGEFLLIGVRKDGSLLMLVAQPGSSMEQQLSVLFGLDSVSERMTEGSLDGKILLPVRLLMEEIGLDLPFIDDGSDLDRILFSRFGEIFPSTSDLNLMAREMIKLDPYQDPDSSVLGWMEQEEKLFRICEKRVVEKKLEVGFGESCIDVDDFISFSLSIQNRRKSRAGIAFEKHLAYIFDSCGLNFEEGSVKNVTENKSKPDFVFPSFAAYHQESFPVSHLRLLGAKTTCKDRWRQVLSEGARIPNKHLVTLEPAISTTQTDEMKANNLQLVVPSGVHSTYMPDQQKWLMGLKDFIGEVKATQ